MQSEEDAELPKRQRPFFNGVVLLSKGVFQVIATVTGQDFWRLNPQEQRDLGGAITGWVYAQPKRRMTAVMKFFTDIAPTLTLFLTVAGIIELRLRMAANLHRLSHPKPAPQPVPSMREPVAGTSSVPPPVVVPSPDAILVPDRSAIDAMGPNPLEGLRMELPAA